MRYYGLTDRGLTRPQNQDSFRIVQQDDTVLAIVCDGIGGHQAGDRGVRDRDSDSRVGEGWQAPDESDISRVSAEGYRDRKGRQCVPFFHEDAGRGSPVCDQFS